MSRPTPIRLDDPDNPIGCAFFHVEPPEHKNGPILIAKFTGRYRPGCQGNPDAAYLVAMGVAAVSYWEPKGVVLDVSQLEYVWGDMMDMVRGGAWAGLNVPFAVV